MDTLTKSMPENKDKSASNEISHGKARGYPIIHFKDNRHETVAQSKLQNISKKSQYVNKAIELQKMANDFSAKQHLIIHEKENRQETVAGEDTVQLFTTVTIKDKFGQMANGVSGNEDNTRMNFAKWPAFKRSFETTVNPKEMPELDKEGKLTGSNYARNQYMCAEPNAFSSLLSRYNYLKHPLDNDWLKGIEFPELAFDHEAKKSLTPCPVCEQWVTSDAPMKIHDLDGSIFKNKEQLEQEEKIKLEETRQKEEEREKMEQKELKKKEKEKTQILEGAKTEVILELKKLPGKFIFDLITLYITPEIARNWELYEKKKKLIESNLKYFTDDCIGKWINSLKTTNAAEIMLYKNFEKDSGLKDEFVKWASENLK